MIFGLYCQYFMSSYDDGTVFSVIYFDMRLMMVKFQVYFCISLVVLTSFDVLGMVRYIIMPYSNFDKV